MLQHLQQQQQQQQQQQHRQSTWLPRLHAPALVRLLCAMTAMAAATLTCAGVSQVCHGMCRALEWLVPLNESRGAIIRLLLCGVLSIQP